MTSRYVVIAKRAETVSKAEELLGIKPATLNFDQRTLSALEIAVEALQRSAKKSPADPILELSQVLITCADKDVSTIFGISEISAQKLKVRAQEYVKVQKHVS